MPAATKKETYDDLLDMVDFESDNENGASHNKGNSAAEGSHYRN